MSNKTQIFKDYQEFFRRTDKSINGVSPEYAELHTDFECDNETNIGCWNCSGCIYCRYCSSCIDCSGSIVCSDRQGLNDEVIRIPKISNIHQKVLEAVEGGKKLQMEAWHAPCGTVHCRAGWVVALAGKKGLEIERETSTEFAANLIYSNSIEIEVGPYHFYLTNEQSMSDIELCAKLEKEGKTKRD